MTIRTAPATVFLLLTLGFRPMAGEADGPGRQESYEYRDAVTGKTLTIRYYKPAGATADAPVLIALHGLDRRPQITLDAFKKSADRHGFMVLAPDFSEENFPGTTFANGNYFTPGATLAQASANPPEQWSYPVVDRIFDDFVKHREPSSQHRFYLYGHSAGGQFVHRMLLFVPETKVKLAIAANSGYYTIPTLNDRWPYGLKFTPWKRPDLLRYLQSPLIVLLGEKDTNPDDSSLARSQWADKQGANRFERGHYFLERGQAAAKAENVELGWRLMTVPNAGHRTAAMAGTAAELVAADIKASRAILRIPPKRLEPGHWKAE